MKTLKLIILFIVSTGVGTFVDVNILEKIGINIWLSRGIGCLVAVIVALIINFYFFQKKE